MTVLLFGINGPTGKHGRFYGRRTLRNCIYWEMCMVYWQWNGSFNFRILLTEKGLWETNFGHSCICSYHLTHERPNLARRPFIRRRKVLMLVRLPHLRTRYHHSFEDCFVVVGLAFSRVLFQVELVHGMSWLWRSTTQPWKWCGLHQLPKFTPVLNYILTGYTEAHVCV